VQLKSSRRTLAAREGRLQMFDGLQQRVGVRAGGWALFAAKSGAHPVQSAPERSSQPIERFQGEGQAHAFRRCFERGVGQQAGQPPPQQASGNRMARQNLRQENGECAPATAAPPTVGAEHALPAQQLTRSNKGILALKPAVTVQGAPTAAVRTSLLLHSEKAVRPAPGRRARSERQKTASALAA